jgi:type VI secretion system protein ImpF
VTRETQIRLPCLLDRLVDHAPGAREEPARRRSISLDEYRAAVLRDLRWLLNSPAHLPGEDICQYPRVARSVLNYGTRALAGVHSDNLDALELEKQLHDAITAFEPRILPETLHVRMVRSDRSEVGRIGFEIKGHLWALPHPEQLFFRTEIDLETGVCEINGA